MKLKKYMILILICVLGCMLIVAGCGKSDSKKEPKSKTITVTDSDGQQVTLQCPPERIVVLASYTAEIIKGLKIEADVVGIDESTRENTKWPTYVLQLPSVGQASNPELEKVVSLKPDMVVGWHLKPEIREKIIQVGIPYVCIYGYKVEKLPGEIRALGQIFKREAQAEEYAGFIEKHWKTVKDRVQNLPAEKKPKVYWESSRGDYSTFAKGSGADPLIRWAGGINIAGEESVTSPKVSAEWVIQKNPDIIIKYVGRDLAGWNVTDLEKLKQLREEIISRPGFKETNAVKNGRVYLVSDSITCAPQGAAGIYYLAKWFHPDIFKDIDPEAIHREMLKKFYDEELHGVWAYPK
jgi:iron complex transport system substrate-binding protein